MKVINEVTEMVAVDELDLFDGNPRVGDLDLIRESIRVNGFYGTVGVQRSSGRIVWGNHRFMAAVAEGATEVPVTWVDCSDVEARRILAVDNRSNDVATYDDQKLADLLASFEDEFAGTGFGQSDLDALLTSLAPSRSDTTGRGDEAPSLPLHVVSKPGDVWLCGNHRVMCGDCRNSHDVDALLAGERVAVAFTSPPYADRRDYDEASGFRPVPPDEYVEWFAPVVANVQANLTDDGSWFVNISPHCENGQRVLYVNDLVVQHVRAWGWMFVDEFCWVDAKNGVPGGWPNRFKGAWEPVFHFARQPTIKFHPLANGTASDDVFEYSAATSKSSTGSGLLGSEKAVPMHEGIARPSNVIMIAATSVGLHSAPFPVDLPAWFIRAFSDRGDVVLDPFAGSGSTMVACEREGRSGRMLDISAGYVDVMCRRYQEMTGEVPVLESTGEAHDFTS